MVGFPQACYEEYACRGESENRIGNSSASCSRTAQRSSILGQLFRLYLHAAALNLLVRLRHATPLPEQTPAELGVPTRAAREAWTSRSAEVLPASPRFGTHCVKALLVRGAHRLIKVAAEVLTRARHVIVRLSSSWPHLNHLIRGWQRGHPGRPHCLHRAGEPLRYRAARDPTSPSTLAWGGGRFCAPPTSSIEHDSPTIRSHIEPRV